MFKKIISIMVLACSVIAPSYASSLCGDKEVTLQVLGSGGPEIDDGRASTSYLIWVDGKSKVLVDMGPGSSVNFGKAGGQFEQLAAIIFTHLHVDHSADFPAFVKGSFFGNRRKDLFVFGPAANTLMPATSSFVKALFSEQGAFPYLKGYISQKNASEYKLITKDVALKPHDQTDYRVNDAIHLKAVPVHHGPVAAVAWRFDILDCSITFSGDMNNNYQTLASLAKNTDLLVMHNAVPESAAGVAANLHMKPSQIGEIARESDAKKVIISHRMRRTVGKEAETVRKIRRHYYGPLIFANDLDVFAVSSPK